MELESANAQLSTLKEKMSNIQSVDKVNQIDDQMDTLQLNSQIIKDTDV